MLQLTPEKRRSLREQAHHLNPVVMVSEAGLTDNVIKEISNSLNAHGLIKIRVFGDDRENRIAIYQQICALLHAAPIQHIGKLLVIYRPKKEKEATSSFSHNKPKVTVSRRTPSRSRTKKVILKGNERLTAGGKIKRAKTRQVSIKKKSLG